VGSPSSDCGFKSSEECEVMGLSTGTLAFHSMNSSSLD
jgi:hypothetical protein